MTREQPSTLLSRWSWERNTTCRWLLILSNKKTVFKASSPQIKYSVLPPAMRHVPNSNDFLDRTPPAYKYLIPLSYGKSISEINSAKSDSSEDNVPVYSEASGSEPHAINQENANDQACLWFVPASEFREFLLQQWELVRADVWITSFRTRKKKNLLHSSTWKTGSATAEFLIFI